MHLSGPIRCTSRSTGMDLYVLKDAPLGTLRCTWLVLYDAPGWYYKTLDLHQHNFIRLQRFESSNIYNKAISSYIYIHIFIYIGIFVKLLHSFISISQVRNIKYNFHELRFRAEVISFQPIHNPFKFSFSLNTYYLSFVTSQKSEN